MPVVEWANDLPEGAFADYESRGAVIAEGEYRAITLPQLHSLATLINQVLDIRDLIDNNKHSSTHGQKITWLMANMCVSILLCCRHFFLISVMFLRYQICDEFVKPLTKRDMCSWVELVTNKDKQECVWFMSHAWLTPFNQTLEMLDWHTRVHQLPGHTGYWFCTLANVICLPHVESKCDYSVSVTSVYTLYFTGSLSTRLIISHSHTLLMTCTCCYDESKGTKDQDFSYSL